MAIGIEGGEPVPSGFIDKNRVNLTADLVEQTVAQQAVFAAAGKNTVFVFMGGPELPRGLGRLGKIARRGCP